MDNTSKDKFLFKIGHKRMIKLVRKIMNDIAPGFNNKNTMKEKWMDFGRNYVEYFDKNPDNFYYKRPYAKYHEWERQLQLEPNVFEDLETILGENLMEFVIDWFNEEFNKDAESITF